MCKFFSCVVMRSGKVHWILGENSHSQIITTKNLKDDTYDPAEMKFARVEITTQETRDYGKVPKTFREKDWTLKIDQSLIPTWWKGKHEKVAWAALKDCLALMKSCPVIITRTSKGQITVRDLKKGTVRDVSLGKDKFTDTLVDVKTGEETVCYNLYKTKYASEYCLEEERYDPETGCMLLEKTINYCPKNKEIPAEWKKLYEKGVKTFNDLAKKVKK